MKQFDPKNPRKQDATGSPAPFQGDLGQQVICHKGGSTPYTLDDFRQVHACILALSR